jgi:serine/threonine-protein kinase
MDADTIQQLLLALRESGLYTPEQLAAAERTAATGDAAQLAESLQAAGVLTPYQFRKIRIGRTTDLLFGPYLILDKIGEGGMGKVYRAAQRGSGQIVALKLVRQALMNNRTVLRRYKREAAAVAALNHPNIVTLYDADEAAGRYFLAMEYVDGIDLSKMVRMFGNPPTSGLPSYQEACEYVRQAALGLQHAHQRGMVHRDVKPSNILVHGGRALPGVRERPSIKILDMGLVRTPMGDDVSTSDLTRVGTVVGTPDYMSPEQAKDSSKVDARADLYSLGCVLYFLLRGQPPFPDGNPIDKLIRHQLDPPPDVRRSRPDVPVELAAVIERLLQKKSEERYATAREVAEVLASFTPGGSKAGRALPAPALDEPFVLAASPDAIAWDHTPAAPVSTPVVPQPTPTAKPGIRLRVVRSSEHGGAGRPVDAEVIGPPSGKVPSPTTVPRSEHTPSSGSLPGTGSRGSNRHRTVSADSTAPSGATRKRTPRRPPPRRSSALLIAAIAIAVAVVVLAVAGAVMLGMKQGHETEPTHSSGRSDVSAVRTH